MEDLDSDIERLKDRYLGRWEVDDSRGVSFGRSIKPRLINFEDRVSTINITKNNSKVNSLMEGFMERPRMKSPISGLTYSERKHYNILLHNLYKTIKLNYACVDNDYPHDSNEELEKHLSEEEFTAHKKQDIEQFYSETDLTLPSGLASTDFASAAISLNASVTEFKNGSFSESQDNSCLLPFEIFQIQNELTTIWQDLQKESVALQEYKFQVQSREQHLANREALLIKHQDAITKLRVVEEEVHAKFKSMKEFMGRDSHLKSLDLIQAHILEHDNLQAVNQESNSIFQYNIKQHAVEVNQLTNAIKEKIKENKRLKSSFDSLKELNDSLKKQINNVAQQNKKLEVQNKKTQSRLENLQRKHDLQVVQKFRENLSIGVKEIGLEKQEKIQPVCRSNHPSLNRGFCELLGMLLDWTSDGYLCYLTPEDENDIQKSIGPKYLSRKSVQEMCVKILPLITAQMYLMPLGDIKMQLALVKFIYWALRHIDRRGTLIVITSTMRRLGEELFQGTLSRTMNASCSEAAEIKPKVSAFFRSSNLNVRFLSALSILKTITQVDYLAQVFDTLLADLNTDEGKALFVEYQALQVILHYLKPSSKNLLCRAVDIILQMTMESRYLQNFLDTCSNESWFCTCSMLLKSSKLEIHVLEKLSVVLQKLSKIKNNKKLFEMFAIHILVQELHRTMAPEHMFLTKNLQSILCNLGIIKDTA